MKIIFLAWFLSAGEVESKTERPEKIEKSWRLMQESL